LGPGELPVFVGDLSVDRASRWVEEISLRKFKKKGTDIGDSYPPRPWYPDPIIDRQDLTQSQVAWAHRNSLCHPGTFPFEVMNYILEGRFSSASSEIRSELGVYLRNPFFPGASKVSRPLYHIHLHSHRHHLLLVQEIGSVLQSFLEQGATFERDEAVNFFTGSYPDGSKPFLRLLKGSSSRTAWGWGIEYLSSYATDCRGLLEGISAPPGSTSSSGPACGHRGSG